MRKLVETKFIYTREEACNIVNCGLKEKPNRIIKKLIKIFGKDVLIEQQGKGNEIRFIINCFVEDLTQQQDQFDDEYYYVTFKKFLIEEGIFKNNFNYDKLLQVIEYYMDNYKKLEVLSLDELSQKLNISRNTLNSYNRKLEKIGILRQEKECTKVVMIKDIDKDYWEPLDYNFYENFLVDVTRQFVNEIDRKYNGYNSRGWINSEQISIYSHRIGILHYDKKERYPRIDIRNGSDEVIVTLTEEDIVGSCYTSINGKINSQLFPIIFNGLLLIHNIETLKVCRAKTITRELLLDDDMLYTIKEAISYNNKKHMKVA